MGAGKRVVVTGASGNVGTAVVEALAAHPEIGTVVGVCRRPHDWRPPRTEWHFLDVSADDLTAAFDGADAVVHLAWTFQPTWHPDVTWRNNVEGARRVLQAAAECGAGAVVVASSVGAYSARPTTEPLDESWPTTGVLTAAYSREKSFVERLVEVHAAQHPDQRVVVMRPAFIFQHASASQQRRLFLGRLVPAALLRRGVLPLLPLPRGLCFQAVHADDVADAYVAAVTGTASGAFNLAADPVLRPADIGALFAARPLEVPVRAMRAALAVAHASHAVPASPGLLDLLQSVPVMDTGRARAELGWTPRHDAHGAVRSFLEAVGSEPGVTPPLSRAWPGVRQSVRTRP